MAFEGWFGKKKNSAPAERQPVEKVPEKSEMEKMEEGSVQAEMRFRFFNRSQRSKVGGESLSEIADKVGGYVAKLEMGPLDSTVSDFSIDIPGHPEVNDFKSLMEHATKA